jgi:hypothetical protein
MILLAVWQRVALVIEISARQSISRSWSTKVLHHNILLQIHQGTTYFASPIYSHVGVASHNNSIYVASTNAYGYHVQESLGFNATRNIQHAYPYSSAISSQYMVPPQDMLIYERIGYGDANYSVNYSQFSYDARYANRTNVLPTNSTSYANVSAHNLASYISNNYGRINEISARHSSANAHDSTSYIANNYGQINKNSERHASAKTHDSASYVTKNYS